MLKVFLVEDESIVREGLKNNIPWQEYGYQYTGEASDGEMALPMIRKIRPDVLITDIKMPFMDGLALSRIVTQEMPEMKIVIISGYDEFEYAQQAIRVGVEQYLLKPITKSTLRKVLLEIREKIETEQEQKNYLETFQNEMKEYENYARRSFLEKVFGGVFSVQQIYEEAAKISLDLNGPCYNLVLLNLQVKRQNPEHTMQEPEGMEQVREALFRYFMRFPEYLIFQWNISLYGILMKGESDQMERLRTQCVQTIETICLQEAVSMEWYAAVGEPVERLSLLPECYTKVNHILAHRFLSPQRHILTEQDAEELLLGKDMKSFASVDSAKVNPDIILGFLREGKQAEIKDFADGYLAGVKDALESRLFRDYLLLNIRFTIISYVEMLGVSQQDFLPEDDDAKVHEASGSGGSIDAYMQDLLERALALRDRESESQGRHVFKKGLKYIEENFSEESLSLNSVAGAIGVSGNYFSSIFSQEMQMTFIEYVTKKRMEKAKKLLVQTQLHSSEIAGEVGYKDPHYFSFVFKKTVGCTPSQYRSGK
ncbi:MAG: response regulator [Lachnospiraceae bacterium]|nr:response regulator [Lachnospiraceae bacterium]MDE7184171.1 response regulator [Lachnospiraceae bacterium]